MLLNDGRLLQQLLEVGGGGGSTILPGGGSLVVAVENCRFGRSWFGSAMALNLSWWGRGGGSKTSLRIGGG